MRAAIADHAGEGLAVSVVWIDILHSDDRPSAHARSAEFDDRRVSYFWDPDRITGAEWQEVLGLDNVAWDVYFLYGRTVRWNELPPKPDFWMHQLGLPDEVAPRLDGPALSRQLGRMLERTTRR